MLLNYFNYDELEDIKVAVSEACTNAVQHAYSEGEHGDVTVSIGMYHDKLELIVADNGRSFNLKQTKRHEYLTRLQVQ